MMSRSTQFVCKKLVWSSEDLKSSIRCQTCTRIEVEVSIPTWFLQFFC